MTENDGASARSLSRVDVLVHPVRLRIVAEFCGRELTSRQLADALPDIPQATLYRQIRMLLEAAVLEVTSRTPTGGAIERTYRVAEGAGRIPASELATLTREQHLEYFSVFVASLVDALSDRLHRGTLDDLLTAGLTYNRTVVHLSDEERDRFGAELQVLINRIIDVPPGEGRSRYTLASVVIPHGRNTP